MKNLSLHIRTIIAAICICALLLTLHISTVAVSYSGSGTMTDPYLVTNAEQLQGMRENLSAHYKLAATIDLSGVDFKPVGRLDNPFTGSFMCELNSDNTPKYIIKNLKIKVAETPFSVEKKNKWEAALFGAALGAMFSGIYLLDVNISNDVLGDNRGAVQYGNYKPGMDEMNAAALIGNADSCTVMNCASTGVIDAKASGTGGLIGRLSNSTMENCYSTVSIKTLGKWHIGGLVGYLKDSTINNCFATGDVKGGQTNIGGFAGCAEGGSITNCYSWGNVSGGIQTKTAFASAQMEDANLASQYKNCYAIGTVKGENAAEVENKNAKNCFVLKGTKNYMFGFSEGSAADIKKAFSGLADWDTSGEYPTLKGIGIVENAAKYKTGASKQENTSSSETSSTVSNTGSADNSQNMGGTSKPSVDSSQSSTGQSAVTSSDTQSTGTPDTNSSQSQNTQSAVLSSIQVAEMIKALPDPEDEMAVTLDCKEALIEAINAYENLSFAEKEDFDATLSGKLFSLKYKVSILMALDVVTGMEELPEEITADNAQSIIDLYADYTFLDDKVKGEIDQTLVKNLEEAYNAAINLSNENSTQANQVMQSELTTFELIITIVFAVITLVAVAFDIFAGCYFIRKRKEAEEVE